MKGVVKVTPTLPATDVERAKTFYTEKLGLKLLQEDPSPGANFDVGGGTSIYVYQRGPSSSEQTLAGFTVEDVKETVEELKSKGVVFEIYDMPNVSWDGEVASMGDEFKAAWFKDSEGNILALDERPD